MICPDCKYSELKEVVLFSSIEQHCDTCEMMKTIRKQFEDSIVGAQTSWKTPVFVNSDDVKISVNGSLITVSVRIPLSVYSVNIVI